MVSPPSRQPAWPRCRSVRHRELARLYRPASVIQPPQAAVCRFRIGLRHRVQPLPVGSGPMHNRRRILPAPVDRIRIKPCDEPREAEQQAATSWLAPHMASTARPRGAARRAEPRSFALDRARAYNASYNHFGGRRTRPRPTRRSGQVGHRPDLDDGRERIRQGRRRRRLGEAARDWGTARGLGAWSSAPGAGRPNGLAIRPGRRALDVLGPYETVDLSRHQVPVQGAREAFHLDAIGGDRSFAERLRDYHQYPRHPESRRSR